MFSQVKTDLCLFRFCSIIICSLFICNEEFTCIYRDARHLKSTIGCIYCDSSVRSALLSICFVEFACSSYRCFFLFWLGMSGI